MVGFCYRITESGVFHPPSFINRFKGRWSRSVANRRRKLCHPRPLTWGNSRCSLRVVPPVVYQMP